ncbi:MAG: epoxyqueuosine reductase [Clostridia bacterium]|nr:epoxyqueuosine reductase [Clostridia bacterium]
MTEMLRTTDLEPCIEYLCKNYGARCGVISGEDFSSCVVNAKKAEGFFSCLVAVFPYYFGDRDGKISMYARFADYHGVLLSALNSASELLPDTVCRACADISPINEVKAAALAGLGCIGRNGLLITPEYGSYVFIGELLFPFEIDREKKEITSCRECGLCVSACPTGALEGKGECLSSLTRKKRLTPSEEEIVFRSGMQWGCDICQKVCPMNSGIKKTAIPEFLGKTVSEITEFDTQGLSDAEIKERYAERSFLWRGVNVLRRNEAISKGELSSGACNSQNGGR